MQNLVYKCSDFSKLSHICAKVGSNFTKILEKTGEFAKNLAQIWVDWYMIGSLFLEKLVFVCIYFQILQRHIPTKLEYQNTSLYTTFGHPPSAPSKVWSSNCLIELPLFLHSCLVKYYTCTQAQYPHLKEWSAILTTSFLS